MSFLRFLIPLCATAALTACGNNGDDRPLIDRVGLTSVQAPDEFAVLPQKPLELPEDLAALPAPTPGAPNRTDLTPEADALVALTGRPTRAAASGSDNALISAAARNGIDPSIRGTLATEDRVFRKNNRGRLLERLFGRSNDLIIYRPVILDAREELLRLRARGVKVPAMPPFDN
ncbi:DUF3035 domain-containing protein [Halovulum sp. GXIMD14793]